VAPTVSSPALSGVGTRALVYQPSTGVVGIAGKDISLTDSSSSSEITPIHKTAGTASDLVGLTFEREHQARRQTIEAEAQISLAEADKEAAKKNKKALEEVLKAEKKASKVSLKASAKAIKAEAKIEAKATKQATKEKRRSLRRSKSNVELEVEIPTVEASVTTE
jgi:hypothetical protein